MERQTSLVNYKYALEKLRLPADEAVHTWLEYLPPLHEYRDRYYGTALHFPLVFIESLFKFRLEPIAFYSMRHFYLFLNYYAAMICFYHLIKGRLKNRGLALTGTAMLILSPRFFAESFYNNKDILFLAWYIIAIFFLVRWLRSGSASTAVLAGAVLAFTINTRLNGIVLLPLTFAFFVFQSVQKHHLDHKKCLSFLLLSAVCSLILIVITPVLWEKPLTGLVEIFQFSQKHPNHGADGNLFFGTLANASQIWYYIPVWILLTVPTVILFFHGAGILYIIHTARKVRLAVFADQDLLADWFVTCAGYLPLLFIILRRVIIYNGWRHTYFFYATIVYLAIIGFDALRRLTPKPERRSNLWRTGVTLPLILSFIFSVVFILRNHPHEYAYFAPLFRSQAPRFSGDYWGIASRELLETIVRTDDRAAIVIDHSLTNAGSINRGLLPWQQRDRLLLVYGSEQTDYILFSRDDKAFSPENFPDFEKAYAVKVEGDEIGILLKRKVLDQP